MQAIPTWQMKGHFAPTMCCKIESSKPQTIVTGSTELPFNLMGCEHLPQGNNVTHFSFANEMLSTSQLEGSEMIVVCDKEMKQQNYGL